MAEKTIDYCDGSEAALLRIFASGAYDEAITWRQHEDNWPLLYHLSPLRANLLRWLDLGDGVRSVLELGAGCGAITSYLCTLPHLEKIVAVEGSEARAEVIRQRCKGADRLTVEASHIDASQVTGKYDLVLLIGVLEYAGCFDKRESPHQRMLEKVCQWVKDDGVLILAIENQLGHKYLAGYPEDHYGLAFEGISDYPRGTGCRTFTKAVLRGMLTRAGLCEQKWFYPFPDYKMPHVVLSDRCFSMQDFDWLTLLELPTRDFSCRPRPLFSEKDFLRLLPSDVVSQFMNSFMVLASRSPVSMGNSRMLATGMQYSRGKSFRKRTAFVLDAQEKILVRTEKEDGGCSESAYLVGTRNLSNLIVDSMYRRDLDKAAEYLRVWVERLAKEKINGGNGQCGEKFAEFCAQKLGRVVYADTQSWVSGKCLDLIPDNCLLDGAGQLHVIDQEWAFDIDLPFQLVVDRGIFILLKAVSRSKRSLGVMTHPLQMTDEMRQIIPEGVDEPKPGSWGYFETWFQKGVLAGHFDVQLDDGERDYAQGELFGRKSILQLAKDKILRSAGKVGLVKRLARGIVVRIDDREGL